MAVAAPVTMFVAPGPIDVVHAIVAVRRIARANPVDACTIDCSLRGWWYGRSWPYSTSAWLRPDTFPCPKIPQMPWMKRRRTSSYSLYCDLQELDDRLCHCQAFLLL